MRKETVITKTDIVRLYGSIVDGEFIMDSALPITHLVKTVAKEEFVDEKSVEEIEEDEKATRRRISTCSLTTCK